MTERTQSPEIREVEDRGKILILDVQPGVKPPSHISIARPLFGIPEGEIDAFSNLVVSKITAPSVKEKLPIAEREEQSTLYVPESVYGYKAIVVGGSPFAAYPRDKDGRPFIPEWKYELMHFLNSAHEKGIPMLGVCYGAQAMAEALGGKVSRMRDVDGKERWEVGWSRVYRTSGSTNDPVFEGLPSSFIVAQNHKDSIVRLPAGASLLAKNEYGVQAFRVGNTVGVEFHPERLPFKVNEYIGKETVQAEMREHGLDPQAVLKLGENYSTDVHSIFTNFLRDAWER